MRRTIVGSFKAAALIGLAVALSTCSKTTTPTEPSSDTTTPTAQYWLGSLVGPDSTQHSGWSRASRDSIWILIDPGAERTGGQLEFYMGPAGADTSLSAGVAVAPCPFARFPAAFNQVADPNLSFRVNLSSVLHGYTVVDFNGVRTDTALIGTALLPGDTLAGRWSAKLCAACASGASTVTSLEPDTIFVSEPIDSFVVEGANFDACSVARIDNVNYPTHVRSSSQLAVRLNRSDQDSALVRIVTVFTPGAAGFAISNGVSLKIRK